ncbi:chemotaxis protein [Helicobacter sp. MIT 21-1697]|uniref:chemotaxis protein CheV n=1 Tax=Helicobacter sp. MIT 21-1697 TaxID=2993733 RepID=UPI00224ADA10|nr:chemotaxis protein [Helicobacter sp. MIT 21-1697]MCX2716191.1 chemotaxis protein [Helicobacter sp. MIT 21-1697]
MSIASNEMELVDFRLYEDKEGETYEGVYGINVAKVSGIVVYPDEIFESPGSPDYLLGMFDLRGEIVPLIDLTLWMNIKPKEDAVNEKKVIVTEFNNKRLGFVVHATKRLRRISWANIEPAMFSLNDENQRGKITGTTRIEDGRTLLILDLESIIDDLDFRIPMGNDNIEDFKPTRKFEGSVLILDDSSIARKLLHSTMTDIGFSVIEAIDGQAGLERLEQLYERWGNDITKHLKLIVSDVEMPKMDGFHFAAQVKNDARFNKIPLIFNSSISNNLSAAKGKEIGAEAYLVKFDAKVFYDEITRILSK